MAIKWDYKKLDQLKIMEEQNVPRKEMAAFFGGSVSAVGSKVRMLRFKAKGDFWNMSQIKELSTMIKSGKTNYQISLLISRPVEMVNRRREALAAQQKKLLDTAPAEKMPFEIVESINIADAYMIKSMNGRRFEDMPMPKVKTVGLSWVNQRS